MEKCGVCSKPLPYDAVRICYQGFFFCGPEGSGCERLGVRNYLWHQQSKNFEDIWDEQ